MLSVETELILANIFLALAEGEKSIDINRQILVEIDDFDPYQIFSYLDIQQKNHINCSDLLNFLQERGINSNELEIKLSILFYDRDFDGVLSYAEFINFLQSEYINKKKYLNNSNNINISNLLHDIEQALSQLLIKEVELSKIIITLLDELKQRSDFNIHNLFHSVKNWNYIEEKSLKNFFERNQITYLESDIRKIIKRLDFNGDGKIDYCEFYKFLGFPNCQLCCPKEICNYCGLSCCDYCIGDIPCNLHIENGNEEQIKYNKKEIFPKTQILNKRSKTPNSNYNNDSMHQKEYLNNENNIITHFENKPNLNNKKDNNNNILNYKENHMQNNISKEDLNNFKCRNRNRFKNFENYNSFIGRISDNLALRSSPQRKLSPKLYHSNSYYYKEEPCEKCAYYHNNNILQNEHCDLCNKNQNASFGCCNRFGYYPCQCFVMKYNCSHMCENKIEQERNDNPCTFCPYCHFNPCEYHECSFYRQYLTNGMNCRINNIYSLYNNNINNNPNNKSINYNNYNEKIAYSYNSPFYNNDSYIIKQKNGDLLNKRQNINKLNNTYEINSKNLSKYPNFNSIKDENNSNQNINLQAHINNNDLHNNSCPIYPINRVFQSDNPLANTNPDNKNNRKFWPKCNIEHNFSYKGYEHEHNPNKNTIIHKYTHDENINHNNLSSNIENNKNQNININNSTHFQNNIPNLDYDANNSNNIPKDNNIANKNNLNNNIESNQGNINTNQINENKQNSREDENNNISREKREKGDLSSFPYKKELFQFIDFLSYLMEIETQIEEKKIELAQREDYNFEDIFRIFEIDVKGYIEPEDLKQGLQLLGLNPSDYDIRLLIKRFDLNKQGLLSYTDFFDMVVSFEKKMRNSVQIRPPNSCYPNKNPEIFEYETLIAIKNLFKFFIECENNINQRRINFNSLINNFIEVIQILDNDRKGFINGNDLKLFLTKFNKFNTQKECDLLFIRLDKTRSGEVSIDEIKNELIFLK